MQLFLNIVELSPFYVTAFWGLTFIFNPVKANQARFALGIFMITASVFYFAHVLYFEGDYELYKKFDVLYVFSRLSAYPL